MRETTSICRSPVASNKILVAFLAAASMAAVTGPALAQDASVQEFGEVPGVRGKAQANVIVEKGSYATLIAVAQASGGRPVGEGVIPRAGIGVDIYVGDKICAADRDIRREVVAKDFNGKLATSATCMTVVGPGKHLVLAEKTNINVDGSKMVLKYSILGGKPEKLTGISE